MALRDDIEARRASEICASIRAGVAKGSCHEAERTVSPGYRTAHCDRPCLGPGVIDGSGSEIRQPMQSPRAKPLLEKADYDAAIAAFNEAIRIDPKNAVAYHDRGGPTTIKANTTRPSPTIRRPSGSTRNWPGVLQPGLAYEEKGELRQGDCRLHRGHPAGPESLPRRIATGADAYGQKGEHDKAIADCTEAIRLDPKDAKAYCNRGVAYGSKGEYDKAIADFTEAIRLDPKYGRGVLQPGHGLRKQGRIRQGHCRLHRGHPARPERSAEAYCRPRRRLRAARASTTRPLPTTPRPSGSTRNMPWRITTGAMPTRTRASTTRPLPTTPRPFGWTRSMPRRITTGAMPTSIKGEYDKAIADYTEAIRLEPEVCHGVLQPGHCLRQQGRTRQGDCRLHGGHPAGPESMPMAYYNRGIAYGHKGEHDKAIADYTEAIRLDPKHADAHYNRGIAYG